MNTPGQNVNAVAGLVFDMMLHIGFEVGWQEGVDSTRNHHQHDHGPTQEPTQASLKAHGFVVLEVRTSSMREQKRKLRYVLLFRGSVNVLACQKEAICAVQMGGESYDTLLNFAKQ